VGDSSSGRWRRVANLAVVWVLAFYVGLTALLWCGVFTQPFGLGWDMAAPLALNKLPPR